MSEPSAPRLTASWIVGIIGGTTLVALTSPLFVRSYLPRQIDPIRGVRAFPEGHTYRWRSEGYANTQIGPYGMPGKTTIGDPDSAVRRIALWGDSQAEGVCVPDHEKLFTQAERLSDRRLEMFPLAQSGDDAANWMAQMAAVELSLSIDLHMILVTDLPDLLSARESVERDPSLATDRSDERIASLLPAFLIQAARNLLTESDGVTARKLRFSVGPRAASAAPLAAKVGIDDEDWVASMQLIRDACNKPIVVLYAPVLPHISGGATKFTDAASVDFASMRDAAMQTGIRVVDLRPQLRESAERGRWPHGFHNGRIGNGHLNADGYRVVAAQFIDLIEAGN